MVQFRVPKVPAPNLFRIEKFGGVDWSLNETQIEDFRTPDCKNVILDRNGDLEKRTGFKQAFTTVLNGTSVNGFFKYLDTCIIASGTKLYEWDFQNEPTEIYTGITDAPARGFTFEDKFYFINGYEYLEYDGTTVQEPEPHIPTVMVSTNPAGDGEKLDDFNLLGAGFKQLFSGDGTSTTYNLIVDELDATTVEITVDTTTLTEGTHFTVDRTAGTINFSAGTSPHGAPVEGTNNVEIIAYKTVTGNKEKITGCTNFGIYGGKNDTRIFLGGHPDYPNIIRRSYVYKPNYFPENSFDKIGSKSGKIVGYANQYDSLVIFKEDSIWLMDFYLENGEPKFITKPLNSQVGCIAPRSIQLVDNNPVFLSDDGIYELVSSEIRHERNVQMISKRINNRLLNELNLEEAVSLDFDNKYFLCVNGNSYILDYRENEWFFWDNMYPTHYIIYDEYLYFSNSDRPIISVLSHKGDYQPYVDYDGETIEAYWKSKVTDLGSIENLKMVSKIFYTMRPGANTSIILDYITDKKTMLDVDYSRMDLFDYSMFDYSKMNYLTREFPQEITKKIKAKKVSYFQIIVRNNVDHESMGIMSLSVKYTIQREVK
jgi:hypothetical protein